MIPLERKRYDFTPDYTQIVKAAWNHEADRLPIYEQHFGYQIMKDMTGLIPYAIMYSKNMTDAREGFRQMWEFHRELGFDVTCHDCWLVNVLEGGGALSGRTDGCIKDRADFERYPWNSIPDRYFEHFGPYLRLYAETCPTGMKAIGGAGNGLFECVQYLVGYVNLCYMRADDEELFHDIFAAMGKVQVEIWERLMREYGDLFCIPRFCDDLGMKTQTLISPADIRTDIIPVYGKIADIVHRAGKPLLLHSCGCMDGIMDDLIEKGKINAKHSNEDIIIPFADFVDQYGDRIGNFGGLDVNVLSQGKPEDIRKATLDILERIQGHGGVAISSGSSVPDYVPAENYLAMNEAVRDWRGDHKI